MTLGNMYGKSFESKYSGSMVGAGFAVFAVWDYIITMTHRGVVELNPKLLAAILGGPEKEVQEAIEKLSSPDAESRCKLEGGRKIVREGQFQYRVVSWEDYQKVKSGDDLREYNRVKQAEYRYRQREKKKGRSQPLPGERASLAAEARGDYEGAAAIAAAALPESGLKEGAVLKSSPAGGNSHSEPAMSIYSSTNEEAKRDMGAAENQGKSEDWGDRAKSEEPPLEPIPELGTREQNGEPEPDGQREPPYVHPDREPSEEALRSEGPIESGQWIDGEWVPD